MTLTKSAQKVVESDFAYQRVVTHVRKLLTDRSLKPGHRLPSERQLASRFGITVPTVRRGLQVLVDEGAIERRVGKGTFVPEIDRPVARRTLQVLLQSIPASPLVLGVACRAAREVFGPLDFTVEPCEYEHDPSEVTPIDVVADRRIMGMLIEGHINRETAQAYRDQGVHVVGCMSHSLARAGFPNVLPHYRLLLSDLVGLLVKAGHRRVAAMLPSHNFDHFDPVVDAYQEACRQASLDDSVPRVTPIPASPRQGYTHSCIESTLRTWALDDQAPTAVIVNDERLAAAVTDVAESLGWRLPDDISLVALGDAGAHLGRSNLTAPDTVYELSRMYQLAAGLLHALLEGQTPKAPMIRHKMTIHDRGSIAPPPSDSPAQRIAYRSRRTERQDAWQGSRITKK